MASAAYAGSANTIHLTQVSPNGTLSGNKVTIDQSLASNSVVDGIGGTNRFIQNALTRLGLDTSVALQNGEGNSATVTQEGNASRVRLLQSASPFTPSTVGQSAGNNSATITAAALSNAVVAQVGANNTTELTLGNAANGLVTQLGSNLSANLTVANGGTGVVTQIGNNNQTPNLSVPANTQLSYTQIGNNIGPISSTAVQVVSASNPGSISITQTAW